MEIHVSPLEPEQFPQAKPRAEGTEEEGMLARGVLPRRVQEDDSLLMASRPGEWKVELYLDGKPQGTYQFEVAPGQIIPSPLMLDLDGQFLTLTTSTHRL